MEICTNTKVDMERLKETRETVETSGQIHVSVHGDMEKLKETKETRETVETSGNT